MSSREEKTVREDLCIRPADETHLAVERERLKDIAVYLKRYVVKTFNKLKENHFALALFSESGAILEMYPKYPAVQNALFHGAIRVNDTWADSGYNAVTEGLRVRRSRATVGEENELPLLREYAVYFSVMNLLEIYEPYAQQPPCGLAIIAPAAYAWDDYFAMVVGIAHDIMLNVQFKNVSTMYYERSGKGLLVVDTLLHEGETRVTYCNEELFRVLGRKPEALIGKKLEELVCPMPENERFWQIIEQNKKIREEYIDLKLQDGTVSCLVSTDAYRQPSIKSAGVVFYFTNDRKKSEEVSRKVANGAVKTFEDVIGEDPKLLEVLERARRMAAADSNILILGESGTGKDVLAQAIHNESRRKNKPFVAINCGAIPRDLIESELFGYEAGTFTGARKNGNMGKFELATGGTVFLDEIGEMPLDLQAKLLRVVEQKQLMRLGGSRLIDVDVKIIAATNIDVREMIRQKRFREDLFYRLSTMRLHLMPLRERRGDIVLLAKYFIRTVSERIGRSDIMRLSPEARELLQRMEWHGNVRELQNLIECIVQLYPDDIITAKHIRDNAVLSTMNEEAFAAADEAASLQPSEAPKAEAPRSVKHPAAPRDAVTREEILAALEACGNNRSKAAAYLGLSRRTFYRRLEEYGI